MTEQHTVEAALAAVRSEPRIGPRFKPTSIALDERGVLTVEAEVARL